MTFGSAFTGNVSHFLKRASWPHRQERKLSSMSVGLFLMARGRSCRQGERSIEWEASRPLESGGHHHHDLKRQRLPLLSAADAAGTGKQDTPALGCLVKVSPGKADWPLAAIPPSPLPPQTQPWRMIANLHISHGLWPREADPHGPVDSVSGTVSFCHSLDQMVSQKSSCLRSLGRVGVSGTDTFNLSTWETEVERTGLPGQPC